jgi:hypothetical protein
VDGGGILAKVFLGAPQGVAGLAHARYVQSGRFVDGLPDFDQLLEQV